MKIETTELDLVWFGVTTMAVLYLVMKAIATLEKMSKKVDAMVGHIGMEVDSTIARLSKEVTVIIGNLEKNAAVCRDNLFEHAQAVELQCYRTKGSFAFGLGPRSNKKKSTAPPPPPPPPTITPVANSSSIQPVLGANLASSACDSMPGKKNQPQLVAIHKCVQKILKLKYRCLSKSFKKDSKRCSSPKQHLETTFLAET